MIDTIQGEGPLAKDPLIILDPDGRPFEISAVLWEAAKELFSEDVVEWMESWEGDTLYPYTDEDALADALICEALDI